MKIIAVLVICLGLAGCMEYSDGQRAGTIIKFSKKGFFCKTWEGEMFLGGLKKHTTTNSDGKSSSTSMVANTWEFTVEDPKLIPIFQAKMEAGEPVTVTYREELMSFCRSDSSSYFATGVK